MKNKKALLIIFLLMTSVSISQTANKTANIRIAVDEWSIAYPPNNEVTIFIVGTQNVGLSVELIFWRGKLPEDQIVYDRRNQRLTVYYAITDFRNVYEMLNTEERTSYVYSPDRGSGESAYLSRF